MSHKPNIDSLLSFRLSVVTKDLKRVGHTMGSLESSLKVGDYAESRMYWSRKGERVGSVSYRIIKEETGLCLELSYTYTTREGGGTRKQRYRLVKRESNLIPGKYRYYILNHYASGESLCSNLYLWDLDGVGFYPRSILSEVGCLYSQQRESHIGRSVWSLCEKANRSKYQHLKHRKTHYRGNPTPFWARYTYLTTESNRRFLEYFMRRGLADTDGL
jgi:hypothetical protein